MAITFQKIKSGFLPAKDHSVAYLECFEWDDYSYKTLFGLTIFDEQGNKQSIGNLKIGFIGQDEGWTKEDIPEKFDILPEKFYSLGQDADYYKNLVNKFSDEMVVDVLMALGDVAHDSNRLGIAEGQRAFRVSLLRVVNRLTIEQQFQRILRRETPLTEYDFFYERVANNRYSEIKVEFQVKPNSKPPSNIHILIGRNGVGKTTLLNNMVNALLDRGAREDTGFFKTRQWVVATELDQNYFAGVVSVSFSAFDPFVPPDDQSNANAGMRYYYVGLKKCEEQENNTQGLLKDKNDLCQDFTRSLKLCFSLTAKRDRWINAVKKLESDSNFADMELCQLTDVYANDSLDNEDHFSNEVSTLFGKMSSGHAIVLLSITKLVETVEEKTLVILDEPESHLHPPLLSAFTRALSDLLVDRNGVAIIATHSPVVLQEVPKSCVSILRRNRRTLNVDRPESETFAENVGILTREVFGLEVAKSGFHDLLANSVKEGKNYEEIEEEYQNQLGFEGKAILRSIILNKNGQTGAEE